MRGSSTTTVGPRTADSYEREIARLERDVAHWRSRAEAQLSPEATERVKAHANVRRLIHIGQLYAGSLHNIGNALGPIEEVLDALRRLADAVDEADEVQDLEREVGWARRRIRNAEAALGRLREMVRAIKSSTSESEERWGEVNLNDLVGMIVGLASNAWHKRELRVSQVPAPGLPAVRCIASNIEEVVDAIFRNAIDASAPGGRILVGTERRGAFATITVADEGAGMSAEIQAKAFAWYFTTKADKTGTGLGLPHAHELVRKHGGRIELTSSDEPPRRGSIFEVWLPIQGPTT